MGLLNHHKKYIIFVLAWFFIYSFSVSQSFDLWFEHLTMNEGLSQNMVDCMLKDKKGFLWFGTWNGLNRFDGYNFTVYKEDPDDSKSISNNFIYSLCEDKF